MQERAGQERSRGGSERDRAPSRASFSRRKSAPAVAATSARRPRPARIWWCRSSQIGSRGAQGRSLVQKIFIRAVEGLVAFGTWVPAHADGQRVSVHGAL